MGDVTGAGLVSENYKTVFMAFEPSYWRGAICTVISLLRRASHPIHLDILTRSRHEASLRKLLERYVDVSGSSNIVRTISLPSEMERYCDLLSVADHFKAEACYRIFYFSIVELTSDALYIDIDTIVRSDVMELFSQLPNCALTARSATPSASLIEIYPQHSQYFNSGVMLFSSLHKRKVEQAMDDAKVLLKELSGRSPFLDQDALNVAFYDHWQALAVEWNYMSTDPEPVPEKGILHATGPRKPWFMFGGHRFSRFYRGEMLSAGVGRLESEDFTWPAKSLVRKVNRMVS